MAIKNLPAKNLACCSSLLTLSYLRRGNIFFEKIILLLLIKANNKNAEKETLLDPSFYPLNLTISQDEAWYNIVKANIKQKPKKWDVTTELLLREREKKNIDNYQLED